MSNLFAFKRLKCIFDKNFYTHTMKKSITVSFLAVAIFFGATLMVSAQSKKGQMPTKTNSFNKSANITQPQDSVLQINPVNGYDLNKLQALKQKFDAKNKLQKEAAIQFAANNNLPLTATVEDERFMELQGVLDNQYPLYFTTFNADAAVSSRANFLNTGGGLGLDLNGDNLTAHVWDGGHARVTHQEYDGPGGNNRVTLMDTGPGPLGEGGTILNFHAAHVTGTIMASGVQADAKGMAWQADVHGYMWNRDVGEAVEATLNTSINNGFGILVSNHSYGFGLRNANGDVVLPGWFLGKYHTTANGWDEVMYDAPYYLQVASAGNDGNDNTANTDPMFGNANYDKLSGMAVAKNNLVVASGIDATIAADGSLVAMTRNGFSSEGPTDDLRIKPDITGNGHLLYSTYESSNTAYNSISGTSMAGPNVAGTILLLQEHYYDLNNTYMRSATLRGLTLHTADDIVPSNTNNNTTQALVGPDATTGWGLVNGKKAAETISMQNTGGDAIIDERTLNQGQTYTLDIQANGTEPLQVSITWTDPEGIVLGGTTPNVTSPRLVNDLDASLNNGSTFFPWRLTSATANSQNGENNTDNFERIDITNPSGIYTLTVSHDGSLTGGSQDYTIIVTGGSLPASTPEIAFSSTSGSGMENSDCSFTDYTIDLVLPIAASADANVSFTIDGASTALEGVDFDLLTPSVTFPSGSTANQSMTLRVYEDGFVEGNETIVITSSLNANGGDATLDSAGNTFTFTIVNDDVVPVASQTNTDYFNTFDDLTGWTILDNDGDLENWGIFDVSGTHDYDSNTAVSFSWTAETNALTPDNFLRSPAITLPTNVDALEISYKIGSSGDATFFREHYSVYFSTDLTTVASMTTGATATVLENDREIPASGTEIRTHDITSLVGQTGHFIFRHHNVTNEFWLGLDDVTVTSTLSSSVQTAVNSTTPDQVNLSGTGTAYALDGVSNDIMAGITNNTVFNYGCTDVSVSRAGTGSQSFNGSVSPDLVIDKTFTLAPSSTTTSGSNTVTFYFEQAELDNWLTTTGLTVNDLVAGRVTGTMVVETAPLTVGTFGSNVTLTGDFTGLNGTYYFGTLNAFSSTCSGGVKTWNGSAWSPLGAPDASHQVVINGNYNTGTHGALTACTLAVNNTFMLTVSANTFIDVDGAITVDGILQVDHLGSVVQRDDTATVNNNGTINVDLETPELKPRDIIFLGSPMTAETNADAFGSANRVMEHLTENFIPHPDVTTQFPLAENFADDNFNDYVHYTGTLQPGEGYLIRPRPIDATGNEVYQVTFEEGTLNNGVITYTVKTNTDRASSYNMLANPYPSAISAMDFMNANPTADAVYFWEHVLSPNANFPGANDVNFSMQDVSMFNSLGAGVAAANEPTSVPSGIIGTGQGFAIKAFDADYTDATDEFTATFTNDMRVTSNESIRAVASDYEVNRLWLEVKNETYQLQSSTLIGFTNRATQGFDLGFDSNRMATAVSLYSHLTTAEGEEKELGIQSREAFDENQELLLGFSTMVDELQTYTISVKNFEGVALQDVSIYLVDLLEGITTNLSEANYNFTASKATFNERFLLRFTDRNVLNTSNFDLETISVYPNPTSGSLTVLSLQSDIIGITVTDIQGRVIASETVAGSSQRQVSLESYNAAVYFITITTEKGSVVKRVIKK